MNKIIQSDALVELRGLADASVDLIYIDPPFNTGKDRSYTPIKVEQQAMGDRKGFQDKWYVSEAGETIAFFDSYGSRYLEWLYPHLHEARRVLKPTGTFYVHLDYREVHYVKIILDQLFGRDNFINELIWAYDYGGRSKKRWPAKHDTILMYVRDVQQYYFNSEAVDRIPYMAPGLVSPEKAARGKLPTDVWWHTIVPTNGKERVGFPTQKPVGILRRVVQASSKPGDLVLDFFAGSGTTGEAAHQLGRKYLLIDHSSDAVQKMETRLAGTWDAVIER